MGGGSSQRPAAAPGPFGSVQAAGAAQGPGPLLVLFFSHIFSSFFPIFTPPPPRPARGADTAGTPLRRSGDPGPGLLPQHGPGALPTAPHGPAEPPRAPRVPPPPPPPHLPCRGRPRPHSAARDTAQTKGAAILAPGGSGVAPSPPAGTAHARRGGGGRGGRGGRGQGHVVRSALSGPPPSCGREGPRGREGVGAVRPLLRGGRGCLCPPRGSWPGVPPPEGGSGFPRASSRPGGAVAGVLCLMVLMAAVPRGGLWGWARCLAVVTIK